MPTTVMPVLSSVVGYVQDVRDIVATMLRFLIMNPGRTSSLWEDKLMSFRKMAAMYESDREDFANKLSAILTSKFNSMFSNYKFEVDVEPSDYLDDTPDGRYTLTFNIFILKYDKDGAQIKAPALLSGNIVMTEDNTIAINYNNTLDNLTLQSKARF